MEVQAGEEIVIFDAGCGINTGPVAAGLVGTRQLEPTVIGDSVNIAQRLEALTKSHKCGVLYSESTHECAGPCGGECLGPVRLSGRTGQTTVYGLFARAPDASPIQPRTPFTEGNK
jgi:adenylate cyclase